MGNYKRCRSTKHVIDDCVAHVKEKELEQNKVSEKLQKMMNELEDPPIVGASLGKVCREQLNSIDTIFEKDVRPEFLEHLNNINLDLERGAYTNMVFEECVNHGRSHNNLLFLSGPQVGTKHRRNLDYPDEFMNVIQSNTSLLVVVDCDEMKDRSVNPTNELEDGRGDMCERSPLEKCSHSNGQRREDVECMDYPTSGGNRTCGIRGLTSSLVGMDPLLLMKRCSLRIFKYHLLET